jgi:hypothetical protein
MTWEPKCEKQKPFNARQKKRNTSNYILPWTIDDSWLVSL